MLEIKTPTLGESISEATVAKWHKKKGDAVKKDELLVELETDKVTLEVNALDNGVLEDIKAGEGTTVVVDQILGVIKAGAAPAVSAPANQNASVAPVAKPSTINHQPSTNLDKSGPAARKIASENNVDASNISGTGKDGRITKGDVLNAIANPPAPSSSQKVASNNSEREKRVKMTKLRQTIAKRLKESQNTAAMLTTFNEVDMTNLMKMRSQYNEQFAAAHGVKLGFMSLFAKACVQALKELPAVNAEIDGDEIVYKNHYDIGVAVGTEQGLVVPVVRDCDKINFADIEKEIARLAKMAREGKLSMAELTGGTFTITNGGIYGSMLSTPIINPPQSGILGLHNITKRPVVMADGSIQARDMMYIALSYDHRIIDGREAVTFLVRVKQLIEDPQRLLFGI
ncbi:MAG: 2-oxoglutarate dehydrogenase complex dihydrolipoyllysine-residue succinyltransferase [Rickettsiales bacterium]|nr:2-oxoglutarate dehydrogenase complex dihydrolipoyllysine-residue succinyltransferase [Rickettsiales bacterium]